MDLRRRRRKQPPLVLDNTFCIWRDQSRLGVIWIPRNFVDRVPGMILLSSRIRGADMGGLDVEWKFMKRDLVGCNANLLFKQYEDKI